MATKYTGDSIVVIKDDRDRVRQSPGMYIPNRAKEGAIHCYYEIIDNSIDELTIPNSAGNHLDITFDKKTMELTVEDNGRGIPHEKMLEALTVLAASGKFNNTDESAYLASGGAWGHGSTVVLFLSSYYICSSTRDGVKLTYEFKDGLQTKESKDKSKGHGTYTRLTLDPKFVDTSDVTVKDIQDRLKEKSYVFPKLEINFTVYENGKEVKKYTYGGKTITDRVAEWKPTTDIIEIHEKKEVTFLKNATDDALTKEKIKVDLAFAYSEDALDNDADNYIISYCNTIKTYAGGTHTDGVKLGIQKYIKNVVMPELKGKDKELPITPMDMVSGLCMFVIVSLSAPEFRGQEKTQLSNQEVKFAVRDVVYDALCAAKNSVIKNIIDFIKRVTRGRIASKKQRKKDIDNAFSKDKPKKYTEITYSTKTYCPEILLAEGDSAADCAVTARDPYNQAVYTISKPENIFDDKIEDVRGAATAFNDLMDICGIEPGPKCDPEKSLMRYIWMLSDGDVDGDSIAISMICLIAKHAKPLIDAGMVGRILPPAYSITTGGKKPKKEFVHTQREFFDKIIHRFIENTEVTHHGKKLSKKELYHLLADNFQYDVKLNKLASRYCIDPKLIEYIVWKYHGDYKSQKKSYWMEALKRYKELRVLVENGQIIIDGDTENSDYINLAFDTYFDKQIRRFKEMQSMNSSIDGYSIDGEKDKTLYDVITTMRKYIPDGGNVKVQRYKGLGELEPSEMKELCTNPETRTAIIVKFKDIERDMEKINIIMSTSKKYMEARSRILSGFRADDLDIDT